MVLKLYYDFLSQPSRALYIFFKLTNIPFESCPVALRKGEHLTDEFKERFSRFQKVPFIHDGDFKLNESIAIVRYLSRKYGINTKWYPSEVQDQARIDEYLEWQHHNTRATCALYFIKKWLQPRLTGTESHPRSIETAESNMIKALNDIESIWLKNSLFICGNQISIADVFAACEIEQPRMAGFEPTKDRPLLKAWLERVRQETNPYYDEAHEILNKIANDPKSKL